ncbi:Transcription factor MYB3R-1 [Hondaea fermentalgiana]|uniref:Transcription factor MYB3R-1 n=1 Tax=Hondaea fermentalgiana TaxID=2315210 RepID=A0A2R5GEI0_9STRA|nr:Transcription factor MYB3R-1 [Hondaea fermentalgiana]|eukprot:GBG29332.1 Transcription factor MYB3R-1 [Hondaea fermentalgiana]
MSKRLGTFAAGSDLSLVVPDMKMQIDPRQQAAFAKGANNATEQEQSEPLSAPPGKGRPPLMRQSSSKRKLGNQEGTLAERGRSRKRSTTVRSLQVVRVPSLEISSGSSENEYDSDEDDESDVSDEHDGALSFGGSSSATTATATSSIDSAAHFHPGQHMHSKGAATRQGPALDPLTIQSPLSPGASDADEGHALHSHEDDISSRRSSTFSICNGLDTVFIGNSDDTTPAYSLRGTFDWDSSQHDSGAETEAKLSMLDLSSDMNAMQYTNSQEQDNTWSSEADAMWAASQMLAPENIEEVVNCNRALSDSVLPPSAYGSSSGPYHHHSSIQIPPVPASRAFNPQQQQQQQQQQGPMYPPMMAPQHMPFMPLMPHAQGQQPDNFGSAAAAGAAAAAAAHDAMRVKEKTTRALSGSKICFRRLWTPEEDALLITLVKKYGLGHWSDISHHFNNSKSPNQCSQRWHKALDPSIKKGKWTKEEDDALVAAVEECGKHWREIARHIPGRTGKQCRDRYTSRLDPSIQNDAPWTAVEEQTILEAHKRLGNKWAAIQRLVPHRSWYSVKWRISILRKQERNSKKGAAVKQEKKADAVAAAK